MKKEDLSKKVNISMDVNVTERNQYQILYLLLLEISN